MPAQRETAVLRWVFTLNNYTRLEYDALLRHVQSFKYIVVGKETGESGTPHLQGFFILNSRFRLIQVKSLPGLNRAHFERTGGTSGQASTYCKKEGDFIEHGAIPLDGPKANIFAAFRDWVIAEPVAPTLADVWALQPHMVRYQTQVEQCIQLFGAKPTIVQGTLRTWQSDLNALIEEDPDDRKIIFVVDTAGNTGKSWLTRYWFSNRDDVQMLSTGKRDDLCYAVDVTKRVFCFDIPRKSMEYFQYPVAEKLKDQIIFSSKYKSQTKILPHKVHVVVFCNEEPDRTMMTSDRYKVIHIRTL
jgi:hypothetical protein